MFLVLHCETATTRGHANPDSRARADGQPDEHGTTTAGTARRASDNSSHSQTTQPRQQQPQHPQTTHTRTACINTAAALVLDRNVKGNRSR